jgi:hypothetical protein
MRQADLCYSLLLIISIMGCEGSPKNGASDMSQDDAKPVSGPAIPDKKSEYRSLLDRYRKATAEGHEGAEARVLRRELSRACDDLVKQELPIGVTEDKVLEILGTPAGRMGNELLYCGESTNYFHFFTIIDNKLTRHIYSYAFDLEAGR